MDEIIHYRALLQYAVILATSGWAFLRGDAPEKWTGAILSGGLVAFIAADALLVDECDYGSIIPAYLALDFLSFLALVPLAMRANRIYPLWLLAAQLIALAMHFQRLLPTIDPLGYFVLTHGPSWVQALAFLAGMIAHRRRIRRFGTYRSWRIRSPL